MNKLLLFLGALALVFASLACTLFGMDFSREGVSLDVQITQEQFNNAAVNLNIGDLFTGSYQLDLVPGKVVVSGLLVRPDGKRVDGSVEFALFAENNELKVEILAINAEGLDLNDEQVVSIQQAIADGLSQVFLSQNMIAVEAVQITEEAIEIQLRGSLP
jgi:hypothetical protein